MSDQTPDSVSEHEPSMEDILASIRKIIADDTPVAQAGSPGESLVDSRLDSNGNMNVTDMLSSKPRSILSAAPLSGAVPELMPSLSDAPNATSNAADGFDVDLDIDDESTNELLDLVDFDLTDPVDEAQNALSGAGSDDILDLTDMLDDPAVALSGNGEAVAEVSVPEMPDMSAEDADFDEMLNLVLDEDGGDVVTSVADQADDAELSALLGDIDAIADAPAAPVSDSFELEDLMDFEETDIEGAEPVSGDERPFESALDAMSGPAESADDELDAMLSQMDMDDDSDAVEAVLAEADIPAEPERVIDPAESLLADDLMSSEAELSEAATDTSSELEDMINSAVEDEDISAPVSSSGDEDIDLVKSLMADLTDDTFEDDDASLDDHLSDSDLEDILDVGTDAPEIEAPELVEAAAAPQDDLSAIVAEAKAEAQAAAQELETLQDGGVAPELEIETVQTDGANEKAHAGLKALMAGAAASVGAGAILASGSDEDAEPEADESNELSIESMLGLEDDGDSEPEAELEPDAVEAQAPTPEETAEIEIDHSEAETITASDDPTPHELVNEEDDMPRIVKSDAITNEETAVAASGAFASLGNVVEQKTVLEESGPRIGDLVQEALKPMLQEWLDKNLKGIVDRAVAKEIKRISSGK